MFWNSIRQTGLGLMLGGILLGAYLYLHETERSWRDVSKVSIGYKSGMTHEVNALTLKKRANGGIMVAVALFLSGVFCLCFSTRQQIRGQKIKDAEIEKQYAAAVEKLTRMKQGESP